MIILQYLDYITAALLGLLVLYWSLPSETAKKILLLVLSIGVLAYLDIRTLVVPLAAPALFYLARAHSKRATYSLVALIVPLVYLAAYKYLPPLVTAIWSGQGTPTHHLMLPLGISYFTFKMVHYVIETRRKTLSEHSLLDFMLYLVFLPIFPAGPIERFDHFIGKASFTWNASHAAVGLQRILFGLAKKFFLVELIVSVQLNRATELLQSADPGTHHAGLVWSCLGLNFLYVYLDFSAYTDLAIGFSRLFGFTIQENFHFPFIARSLSEFWRRWHMTLSQWCQYYVYYPVIGLTRNTGLGLILAMITIGLWHAGTPNRFVWGLYHGLGLLAYSRWSKWRKTKKYFRFLDATWMWPLHTAVVMGFVSFGYVFITTKTLPGAFSLARSALGF